MVVVGVFFFLCIDDFDPGGDVVVVGGVAFRRTIFVATRMQPCQGRTPNCRFYEVFVATYVPRGSFVLLLLMLLLCTHLLCSPSILTSS